MAEQKYNITPKMGRLIVVKNQNRKPTAKDEYISLKVENLNGGTERYVSFTQCDLDKCPIIDSVDLKKYIVEGIDTSKNASDVLDALKAGRIYPAKDKYNRVFSLIKTMCYNPETDNWYILIIRVCTSRMDRITKRDAANPEDRATVSWYYNMFD